MAYIKLEDVQKILDKYTFYSWILRDEINSLPSIDFEEMILEKIEELNKIKIDNYDKPNLYNNMLWWTDALKELLNKLPK